MFAFDAHDNMVTLRLCVLIPVTSSPCERRISRNALLPSDVDIGRFAQLPLRNKAGKTKTFPKPSSMSAITDSLTSNHFVAHEVL